jgi:hypothetical protein
MFHKNPVPSENSNAFNIIPEGDASHHAFGVTIKL